MSPVFVHFLVAVELIPVFTVFHHFPQSTIEIEFELLDVDRAQIACLESLFSVFLERLLEFFLLLLEKLLLLPELPGLLR
jgi:hypothetical protein